MSTGITPVTAILGNQLKLFQLIHITLCAFHTITVHLLVCFLPGSRVPEGQGWGLSTLHPQEEALSWVPSKH